LDRLETGQTELRSAVARLETGQTELRGTAARLETGYAELRGEVGRLDRRIDTLDRHMHVLHEETISRIAAISEGPWATKADIKGVVDKIDELVGGRIVPLEVAVRSLNRERKARGPRRG
jgi:predicted nuclease with TOPRIM domain